MLAKKKVKENFSVAQKVEASAEDNMILAEDEAVHFKNEINKQLTETKIIDIGKAVRNARYLAMLDRGFKSMEEGRGRVVTDEEMERLIYGA